MTFKAWQVEAIDNVAVVIQDVKAGCIVINDIRFITL